MEKPIDTFVINLEKRVDRKLHAKEQFINKPEFNFKIIKASEDTNGALGLWLTIRGIIEGQYHKDYIILCEDDHTFTKNYQSNFILKYIVEGRKLDADILLGGVSWFNDVSQVSLDFFWVDMFTGLQFAVIYKKFYNRILDADFGPNDVADRKISKLSAKKFLIHPFISVQKEFGYSDITIKNNAKGYVNKIFKRAISITNSMAKIRKFYGNILDQNHSFTTEEDFEGLAIPTFLITTSSKGEHTTEIMSQFEGKTEFELHIIQASKVWECVVEAIKNAISNDQDVIILCLPNHVFTNNYSKKGLFKSIIKGNDIGLCCLIGGVGRYGQAVHAVDELYWIDNFTSAEFIVLYRDFFQTILDEPVTNDMVLDLKFSEMTSRKMLVFPFISIPATTEQSRTITEDAILDPDILNDPSLRLKRVKEISLRNH